MQEEKKSQVVDFNVLKLPHDQNDDLYVQELNNNSNGYIVVDFADRTSSPSVYYCLRSLSNQLDLTNSSVGQYYSSAKYNTPMPRSIHIIENKVLRQIESFQEKAYKPQFFKSGHKAYDKINEIIQSIDSTLNKM